MPHFHVSFNVLTSSYHGSSFIIKSGVIKKQISNHIRASAINSCSIKMYVVKDIPHCFQFCLCETLQSPVSQQRSRTNSNVTVALFLKTSYQGYKESFLHLAQQWLGWQQWMIDSQLPLLSYPAPTTHQN